MAEEIREQVSDILRNHLSDPRLAWISVVRVEVSKDLSYAKIYITVLGSDANQEGSLRVLARARQAVRSELSRRLRVRKAPEIDFRADHSIAASLRIQQILTELGLSDPAPDGTGASLGDPAEDAENGEQR
jgi:ribosome-binding factor A